MFEEVNLFDFFNQLVGQSSGHSGCIKPRNQRPSNTTWFAPKPSFPISLPHVSVLP